MRPRAALVSLELTCSSIRERFEVSSRISTVMAGKVTATNAMARTIMGMIVPDPAKSKAARDCVELAARFRRERPELWLEDWGG